MTHSQRTTILKLIQILREQRIKDNSYEYPRLSTTSRFQQQAVYDLEDLLLSYDKLEQELAQVKEELETIQREEFGIE